MALSGTEGLGFGEGDVYVQSSPGQVQLLPIATEDAARYGGICAGGGVYTRPLLGSGQIWNWKEQSRPSPHETSIRVFLRGTNKFEWVMASSSWLGCSA